MPLANFSKLSKKLNLNPAFTVGLGQTLFWQKMAYCLKQSGVVGWCEGAVYLISPGCPADIGLQLGKACYPCSG